MKATVNSDEKIIEKGKEYTYVPATLEYLPSFFNQCLSLKNNIMLLVNDYSIYVYNKATNEISQGFISQF